MSTKMNLEDMEGYHKKPIKCSICGRSFHWDRGFGTHTGFHKTKVIDEKGHLTQEMKYRAKMGRKGYHNMTLDQMKTLYHSALVAPSGKIVGYLSGVPVIANPKVPRGELWVLSEREFLKVVKIKNT